ncbi:MAG: phosphate signaling complex protein PhoU [Lachnospiraceae bacterium]|nr:phosphate signaling complex protein PhoU [Lachnospiraceae bacterium]
MALRKVYEEQLNKLHDKLTQMGSLCTLAVELAIESVKTGDKNLAERTRETDEVIEQEEQEIEYLCQSLLLKQQPVAGDLRRISAAQKMVSDLERIGDQSADIAEISSYIIIRDGAVAEDIYAMAREVTNMVSSSVDAFIRNDLALARDVIDWDDRADACFVDIKDDLIEAISEDNSQGGYYVDVLMVAKYLERIGDHAANVAEWVKYSILGTHDSEAAGT